MSKFLRLSGIAIFLAMMIVSSGAFLASSSLNQSPGISQSALVTPAQLILVRTDQGPTCSPSGLCPKMMDKAYGFDTLQNSGVNGTGQTIVIDDACGDPNIASDLKAFDSQFKLPNPKLNVIYPQGKKNLCVDSGWEVETALDVEWSHVVAPAATIDLLVANQPSAWNVYNSWNYSLDHNLGNEISNSFGGSGCDRNCNSTIGQGIGDCTKISGVYIAGILQTAEEKNVTIMASAGDSGAWAREVQEQPIPGDCAGVLTVGGTTLEVTSSGGYTAEAAWDGTGGGYTYLKEPSYQVYAKIKDPYHTLAKPDVAADADPDTGVWIYVGGWGTVGGTSLSSPLWCGFMALVNQIRAGNSFHPAGFINPFLYTVVYGPHGNSSLYSHDIHDIKTGNNGYPAGKGWDPDTGIGSFKAPELAETLGSNESA